MSSVVNTEGYKAGSIYRIALKNFVTYKEVELFPGSSLNLIIGPNGTGKSTFVCAIILGLCGKTSVIGRAKKISEYVRSGCQEATIELELYRDPGEQNVIITRTFNLKDVTTWRINGQAAREKAVQELIATMNIQVDNLCQLLPQDRVQDFAKMDPQQLLRSTLAAVGGHERVEQLDELIKCREEQRGLTNRLQNNQQLLAQKKRQNEKVEQLDELIKCREEQRGLTNRLQNNQQLLAQKKRQNENIKKIIEAMNLRKEIEEQITMYERKMRWIEYQELLEKRTEYQKEMEQASKLVQIHKKSVAPLEQVLSTAHEGIGAIERQKLNAAREVRNLKDKIKDTISLAQNQELKLRTIDDELKHNIKSYKDREKQLTDAKIVLDKLISDKENLDNIAGNDEAVKNKLADLNRLIAKMNAGVEKTNSAIKLQWQNELDNKITPHIRSITNKIRQMENVYEKRLEVLERFSPDTYHAVCWLRENRELFRENVYEPMMLEINFTEPRFARYLESTVANRDLLAFTFESNDDMNLFLNKVRKENGWRRVNAICSQPGAYRYKKNDIEELRFLGFHSYMVDTITAPDPIIRFLCTQYGIHTIPIGNDHTYENSKQVPSNIRLFYSENHRFSIRVSSYSGDKAISTSEVRPARLLANTLDLDQLDAYKTELEKLENKAELSRGKIKELNANVATMQKHLNELTADRKRINDRVDERRRLDIKIRSQTRDIEAIENQPALNEQEERAKSRRKQRDVVLKLCKFQQELRNNMKEVQTKLLNGEMWKAKLELSRSAIHQQESELRELKDRLSTAQQTLENVKRLLGAVETKARDKLNEARQICNSKLLPHHSSFPYKEQFEKLPSELASLQGQCYELQARIQLMNEEGDERTIREYNEREKEIADLEEQVNNNTDFHKRIETRMKKISSRWLPPLESLLRDIDCGFSEMFEKLGCAGEVKLERAAGEEDYDKYGIAILVRFRTSEQLQQLTRHAQSGGERALSTAMYLMALQRLTKVPFRCVDEINQGMDAINERKMFQLLVKVTTECDNAQYFLLTPKLLTNLEYNSKVMVHTIMNGKHVLNYKEWRYRDFLKRARSYQPSS